MRTYKKRITEREIEILKLSETKFNLMLKDSQIQLDFTVHQFENSAESQINLDANRVTFSSQCKKVFDLLMEDDLPISVKSAMVQHNINSLPRRILDLKENGVLISDRWIEVSEIVKVRFKVWYMTPEQIEFNKTLNK